MAKYTFQRPKGRIILAANDKGEAVCTVSKSLCGQAPPPPPGPTVEVYLNAHGAQVSVHCTNGTVTGEADTIYKLEGFLRDALSAVSQLAVREAALEDTQEVEAPNGGQTV